MSKDTYRGMKISQEILKSTFFSFVILQVDPDPILCRHHSWVCWVIPRKAFTILTHIFWGKNASKCSSK